jgi:hypothetical protein
MARFQVAWWMWAVGTVLIVLSWFDVVSHGVGWCGFGIGLFGSVLGWGLQPPSGKQGPSQAEAAPTRSPDEPKK